MPGPSPTPKKESPTPFWLGPSDLSANKPEHDRCIIIDCEIILFTYPFATYLSCFLTFANNTEGLSFFAEKLKKETVTLSELAVFIRKYKEDLLAWDKKQESSILDENLLTEEAICELHDGSDELIAKFPKMSKDPGYDFLFVVRNFKSLQEEIIRKHFEDCPLIVIQIEINENLSTSETIRQESGIEAPLPISHRPSNLCLLIKPNITQIDESYVINILDAIRKTTFPLEHYEDQTDLCLQDPGIPAESSSENPDTVEKKNLLLSVPSKSKALSSSSAGGDIRTWAQSPLPPTPKAAALSSKSPRLSASSPG